jgi:hypothetical protein
VSSATVKPARNLSMLMEIRFLEEVAALPQSTNGANYENFKRINVIYGMCA